MGENTVLAHIVYVTCYLGYQCIFIHFKPILLDFILKEIVHHSRCHGLVFT